MDQLDLFASEALHPEETGHGKATANKDDNLSSFVGADATAAVTGTDPRTVRRDAERGEKVIPEVIRLPTARWGAAIWRPRVMRVAEVLERQPSEKAKAAYWAKSCSTIATLIGKHGASYAEIQRELDAFYSAVDSKLASQRLSGPA
jgi:hypothetical protein